MPDKADDSEAYEQNNLYYIKELCLLKFLCISHRLNTHRLVVDSLHSYYLISMMGDPYSTSAFLDSSCFSILYPLYHNPEIMNNQQHLNPLYPEAATAPREAGSNCIGPTHQRDILSNAVGIPQQVPISFATAAQAAQASTQASAHAQGIKCGSAGRTNRSKLEAPINSSFISRMYSAQVPNQSFPENLLVNVLEKELKILNANDYFINHLFPMKLMPLGMTDHTLYAQGLLDPT